MSALPGAGRDSEQFVVDFDPEPTAQRIDRYRRLIRSRLISLGITVVVLVVLAIWKPSYIANPVAIALYVVIIALAVVGVGVSYALHRRAKRPLSSLGANPALRLDRRGATFTGVQVDWAQIAGLAVRRGAWGMGPLFELARRDGPALMLPLDQLATQPATIDSAARALSGGRHGVDLSELDN